MRRLLATVFVILTLFAATNVYAGELSVTKCTVTAGKTEGYDTILVSGKMNATADDLSDANEIQVTIDSNDMVSPCVQTFPINETTFKKGKYKCSKTENPSKISFTFDTKTTKFSFTAKNVDLSGLGCPLTIEIEIGDYTGAAEVNEVIVNGKKKPIPIKLMMGVKNALRFDSYKATRGKKLSSDQLTAKGGFAVEDTDVNMAAVDFVVELADQTFTIPAGSFTAKKGVFTCKNVKLSGGEIANASFNLNTSSFTITIKNITIEAGPGAANFSVEFADFSVSVQIVLPANIIVGGSYGGTWIGQFNLRYIDYTPEIPVERSKGFSITITLKSIVVANGIAFLTVTHANVNDPYFGCQVGGCTPDFGSVATLQVPPENISTLSGMGIVIIFPNGVTLATANGVGEMHMSSNGSLISNSLGVTESWEACSLIGSGCYETVYLPVDYDIIEKTWAFTKSAL